MSFDSCTEKGCYRVVIFATRTQSRASSRDPAAERTAGAQGVLTHAASRALSEGCMRPLVMLVVGRALEAAAPSRVRQELSVEP